MSRPVVLVLDDVHVLHNRECRAALSVLADHARGGSRLAFAGRGDPPLRVARLRAEGRILAIGPGDLSLTLAEAAALVRNTGVVLGADELAELHQRTEGWLTGLYLTALDLREGAPFAGMAAAFGSDARLLRAYMESEFLSRISQRQRAFLTRTAVLDRMGGPLCVAVLELPGSHATLTDLVRSNVLLVPLDRHGEWYRCHHLFRDMLLAELNRQEPGLIPVLQRRAASWCLQNELPEQALEYCIAAGDTGMVADLVAALAVPGYRHVRVATVQRWFRWLEDRGAIGKHPMVAVLASFLSALTAQPVDAERWGDVVDRWQYGDAARPDDPSTVA
jgi:LuxR family maltose regulon positive regulatory protein